MFRKLWSNSIKVVTAAILVSLLAACETVPGTGRQQLLLISPSQEQAMGLSEFNKLKEETPISRDARLNAMLQRVGKRISAVAPLPNARWEFVLFEQPDTANAFCLPGGKVGIYTGILQVTKDENGLATVIGHEVAHAVARHGAERVSQGLLFELGGVALDQALQGKSSGNREAIMSAYGIGGTVGVILPHSRKQELEADHLGLMYMARAGYDPRNAVHFWKRFSDYGKKNGGGKTLEFLSTHPVDSTRIKKLNNLMPQAMIEYNKYKSSK